MNNATLFAYLRRAPFGGSLSTSQVAGINAILAYCLALAIPKTWIAYILATAYHETDGTFKPIQENLNYTTTAALMSAFKSFFKTEASAKPYLRNPQKLANFVYGNRLGNTKAGYGWLYRGRGFVQVTFHDNYAKFGLVNTPDDALKVDTAVRIIVDGMMGGKFTGKKLADFGTDDAFNALGARAIVGRDKASLIAGYHKAFLDALNFADEKNPDHIAKEDDTALNEAATPDDLSLLQSGPAQALISTVTGGGALSALAGLANPYAFAFLGLVVVVGALFAWGYFSGRIHFKRA